VSLPNLKQRRDKSTSRHAPTSTPSMHSSAMGRRALLLALVAAAIAPSAGFKFMTNWKMPTLESFRDSQIAQDKFGDKKLVVVTGTSSGLGKKTAKALLRTGQYHVVGAVRDLDKMEVVAEEEEFNMDLFTPMYCNLNNFSSVHEFVDNLMEWKAAKPLDRLICNAGVRTAPQLHAALLRPPFLRLITRPW
jgi:protochlorophyllide reductase